LFDVTEAIADYCDGQIEVAHGTVKFDGEPVVSYVTDKILAFRDEGLPIDPLVNFLKRVQANPSRRAQGELYKFLEHRGMPVTPDGCFLAYKGVRSDYMDIYSGKFSNAVGQVLEMTRNKVDDDANVGCSYGFHAGSLAYASDYAGANGRLMIVKIDPADVVSVPHDCNCQKLRTCKYEVVGEETNRQPLPETMTAEDAQWSRGFAEGEDDYLGGDDSIADQLVDGPFKEGYIAGWDTHDNAEDDVNEDWS